VVKRPAKSVSTQIMHKDNTMKHETKDNGTLDCHYNGQRRTLAMEEAYRLFWACDYAWLLPLDWYRWDVGGRVGADYVFKAVFPSARMFGLLMHTRGTRTLTIAALDKLAEKNLRNETFNARAARFNKLFRDLPPELRPFSHYEEQLINGKTMPAYRMNPERNWLVVVGAGDGSNEAVDWAAFLEPPSEQLAKRRPA